MLYLFAGGQNRNTSCQQKANEVCRKCNPTLQSCASYNVSKIECSISAVSCSGLQYAVKYRGVKCISKISALPNAMYRRAVGCITISTTLHVQYNLQT